MSLENKVALIAFMAFVLAGLFILTLLQTLEQRPSSRLRVRMRNALSGGRGDRDRLRADHERARVNARRLLRRRAMGILGYHLNRLESIGSGHGSQILIIAGLSAAALSVIALLAGFLPEPLWLRLPIMLVMPPLAMLFAYNRMEMRFQKKFLEQLPDALDFIVRASQAGVPANHALRTVGEQYPKPLGLEFRRMGDGLLLGNDLQDVLDDAALRVGLPDFSFFSVCLLLQRETGGPLSEALENLSTIIRARRDLRAKTRALTAEGRMSSLAMSVMPFILFGITYASNPENMQIMFTTSTGRLLLWIAIGMLTIGLLMIRKIANMKV
jgi:Flp pilus assembly protein TadB